MKNDNTSKVSQKDTKKKSKFTRILILVLIFAVAVVSAFLFSDLFFSDDGKRENEPELVAVRVTSEGLILNDGEEVTLDELREHLNELKAKGEPFVGSIINDTANPADVVLYNQVVDLFAEFDIICEKLPIPSTDDEALDASSDEVAYANVA